MKTAKRERFNVLTSFPGAVAAPVGLVVLEMIAVRQGDPAKVIGFGIYGTCLVLLYAATTLFHHARGTTKLLFKKLDHYAIYLLIAGTYTPLCLVTLRGAWGWTLLALVWGLAIFGIGLEVRPHRGARALSMTLYLTMGWLVVAATGPLLRSLALPGVIWLAAGGLFYTGGTIFYALERRFVRAHGFWHICVLAGSLCHYLAILLYVA
jgi:hemolysin III